MSMNVSVSVTRRVEVGGVQVGGKEWCGDGKGRGKRGMEWREETHSKHLPKLLRDNIRDHPRRIRFSAFVPYWDGKGLGGEGAGGGPLLFIAEGLSNVD